MISEAQKQDIKERWLALGYLPLEEIELYLDKLSHEPDKDLQWKINERCLNFQAQRIRELEMVLAHKNIKEPEFKTESIKKIEDFKEVTP
jgi:hypothetical protein